MSRRLTGATLFSGIHAPECAAPEIDWKFCAEIDAFPAAVGGVRHPNIPNLGDVTAPDFIDRAKGILNGSTLDVLVFGSPCQGFSVAGRRLGLDDPRSNLALRALGIVRELAPAWFVFENVPGLFSSWSGGPEDLAAVDLERGRSGPLVEFVESSDFAEFLRWVSDIGYFGAWKILDAQYSGVAQRRERVFFVGHPGDWRCPAAVLLEPEGLCGNPPARGEARQRVASGVEVGPGGGRFTEINPTLDTRAKDGFIRNQLAGGGYCMISPALTASGVGVSRCGNSRGQDPVVVCEK